MNQFTFGFGDSSVERETGMAVSEQPQQRLDNFGAAALSDTELLATLLQGSGMSLQKALAAASRLMAEATSISKMAAWTSLDYRRVQGISEMKARQLTAMAEIARRMMSSPKDCAPHLGRADLVAAYFHPITAGLQVEKFWVVCLNRKNRLMKCVEVTSGTASNSLVHPREVFREAIREGALGVACVHNHPSGDPTPSSADIQVTRQLREASRTIGIDLIDHVIVGSKAADPSGLGYYSFRSSGII